MPYKKKKDIKKWKNEAQMNKPFHKNNSRAKNVGSIMYNTIDLSLSRCLSLFLFFFLSLYLYLSLSLSIIFSHCNLSFSFKLAFHMPEKPIELRVWISGLNFWCDEKWCRWSIDLKSVSVIACPVGPSCLVSRKTIWGKSASPNSRILACEFRTRSCEILAHGSIQWQENCCEIHIGFSAYYGIPALLGLCYMCSKDCNCQWNISFPKVWVLNMMVLEDGRIDRKKLLERKVYFDYYYYY